MRKLTLLAGAMFLAAPIFAGDTGWFVGTDATLGAQTGNDVVLASINDNNLNIVGVVKLQMDAKVTPRIYGGYHADFGTVTLSGWTNKSTGSTSAYDPNGFLLLSMGSPWNPDLGRANGLWARQESKSHAIDITFSRDIAKTDTSNFEWMVGLREWKMENTIWSNACQNDASGVSCLAQDPHANPYTNVQDTIRENSDSHGIGLTIGLKGHYKFNNRISAASWARFGMLRGTATLGNQDENWFGSRTTTRCDTTGSYCTDFSYSTRRTFQQMDFGAKLLINIWSGLSGYAGYTFSTYQDGVTSVDYTSNGGVGLGTAIRTRNVGYDGFLLGLNWKF